MGRKKSGSKSTRSSKSRDSHAKRMDRIENKNGNEYGNENDNENEFEDKRTDRESKFPIDVYSRLSYPLVRSSLPEDLDGGDEENASFELTVKPRFVFVSSLCAVCLDRSKVLCERCQMVSYCSPEHRELDLQSREHGDLCETLAEIRASIASTLSVDSKERLDAEEYRVYRLRLLEILSSRSGRPLQLWEREIVLYPRVCRVCRSFGETVCCAACGMECFCPSHRDEHEKWCKEFRVLRRCLSLQQKHGCVEPKIPRRKRREFAIDENRISDIGFDELTRRLYGDCSYYREMDCYTYSMLSHLCTIPLTTLYAMETLRSEWRNKPELAVHVLGAEFQFEGVNLHVWERIFLHLSPQLKKLRVTLVGPELRLPSGVPARLLSRVKLCSECKAADRAVVVRFRPNTLYHEMSRSRADGVEEKPDIVCAFNPGLYRTTGYAGRDTWPETIRAFSKLRTPVVVTSYTEQEIFWEIERIKSIARDVDVVLEPRQNPFASIKPDRNFVSDHTNPLIYKNYYVAVVEGTLISS